MRRTMGLAWVGFLACEAGSGGLDPRPASEDCAPSRAPVALGRLSGRPGPARVALTKAGLYFGPGEASQELRLWPADGGDPRTVFTGTSPLRILDGRGGRVVVHPIDSADLIVVPVDGEPFPFRSDNGSPSTLPLEDGPPPQMLDGDSLAYVFGDGALELADVGAPDPPPPGRATLLPARLAAAPVLRGGHLVYQGYNFDEPQLTLYRIDGWANTTLPGPRQTFPVLTDDEVLYLAGDQVRAAKLNTPNDNRVVIESGCSSLSSDGRRVILSCGAEPNAPVPYLTRNQTLYLYDHGQLTPLSVAGPATLPVLSGEWLAYYAYEPTTFSLPGEGRGRLILQRLDRPEVHELGPITHGCFACAAYHPLPRIHFDGELLAYDYDLSEDTLAWRLFRLPAECPN